MKKTSEKKKPKPSSRKADATPQAPVSIVGIGASAGGIEAISEILELLPSDTGLAFVIIQHLPSQLKSSINQVFARRTSMSVRIIRDGMAVAANEIYVMPSGHDVILVRNTLRLIPRKTFKGQHLCIDTFFESLALSRNNEAMGIVLTGAGTDGTLGLQSIKARGGLTFAQEPRTAKFDGMPRSAIASGYVDTVLSLDALAEELVRVARHSPVPASIPELRQVDFKEADPDPSLAMDEDPALKRIFGVLRAHTQVNFAKYKITTVKRRIQRQMMLKGIDTLEAYADHLERHLDDVKALYDDMFIQVTDFFRDPSSFDALRERVFPEFLKKQDASVRVWVSGCATGEEAYSLAIAIIEYFSERDQDLRLQIFATDISEDAIRQARRGIYSEFSLRNLDSTRIETYFDKTGEGYKVKKSIRDVCIFSQHDVANNPPFPRLDLISCRNVLIYFGSDLQKRVFPVFHYALSSQGFLWLGQAENPGKFSNLFAPVDKNHKIYRRLETDRPALVQFPTGHYVSEKTLTSRRSPISALKQAEPHRNVDQMVLLRYAPAGVIVNHAFHIQQFRGRTAPYLEPPHGQPSHEVLKMVHPDLLVSLRAALQTAKKQNVVCRKEGIAFKHDGVRSRISIEVTPIAPLAGRSEREYLVLFESRDMEREKRVAKNAPKTKRPARKTIDTRDEIEKRDQAILHLQQELDSMREYQQSLLEQFEAIQEELTSSNEELQSTNEELQSTNEELGTAKEELQSSNEELSSTNDELQKRNHELQQALDAGDRTERRYRLILESINDYAIFMLDPQGRVAYWSEAARRIMGYEADEIIGQHFSRFYPQATLQSGLPERELKGAAATGRYEDEGWRVRKDGSQFWANVVISAIRDSDGVLIGFSKVTRDLTERKKHETELLELNATLERRVAERTQELMESEERFRAFAQSMPQLAWMANSAGEVFWFNDRWSEYTGWSQESLRNQSRQELHDPQAFPEVMDRWQESVRTGTEFSMEFPLRRHDGVYHWFLTRVVPVRNSRGEVTRWFGTNTDVHEQRKLLEEHARLTRFAEEHRALAELEREKLHSTFSQTPVPIAIIEGERLRFTFANAAYEELIGHTDVRGQSMYDLLPEVKDQGYFDLIDNVLKTGQAFIGKEMPAKLNARSWRGETRYFNVVFSPLRQLDGRIDAVTIVALDVTEQVRSLHRVEDAEARLKLALTSAKMGTWNVRIPERTLEIDDTGLSIFDIGQNEFDGTLAALYRRVHPDDMSFVETNLQQSLDDSDVVNRAYRVIWRDGTVHWVQSQGQIFRRPNGEISHITGTVFDATEKLNVEEELRQAVAARDEFLSIASHELKTPITSLKLQLQMIQRGVEVASGKTPSPQRLEKVLSLATRQITRLEILLEDLLDVAKIRAGKLTLSPESVEVTPLIHEVLERFEVELKTSHTRLELDLDETLVGFWDRGRIEQVLINLLSNAIKYAPGTMIRVHSARMPGNRIQIRVSDLGPGIPQDKQALIFERFERVTASRSITGLGLGLFIVKQIVQGHQGSIQVESEVGQGTCFVVDLPSEPHFETPVGTAATLGKERAR